MSTLQEQIDAIEHQLITIWRSFVHNGKWTNTNAEIEYNILKDAQHSIVKLSKLNMIPLRVIAANMVKENPKGTVTVPCKWCEEPTPMLGTKQCDSCYELSSRISSASLPVLMQILHESRNDIIALVIRRKK